MTYGELMALLPEQQPQKQDALNDQLAVLEVIATRYGLYDAADFIARVLDKRRGWE